MLFSLSSPQVLEISGADAIAFAHAQFSSDVRALAPGHWQWSAWLSAQGRVRAFFLLLLGNDRVLRLVLRGSDAAQLRMALAAYVLRAKVSLSVLTDWRLAGTETAGDLNTMLPALPIANQLVSRDGVIALSLPGTTLRWLLLYAPTVAVAPAMMSDQALNHWHLTDIEAGMPELSAQIEDTLLPHWLGLDRLGAISVSKGCYPGQEMVARLHFKGGNKRWPYHVGFIAARLPAPGTLLRFAPGPDGEVAGQIINSARAGPGQGKALAVLRQATAGDHLHATEETLSGITVISAVFQ